MNVVKSYEQPLTIGDRKVVGWFTMQSPQQRVEYLAKVDRKLVALRDVLNEIHTVLAKAGI